MAGTVLLWIFGLVLLAGGVYSFRGKGPLLMTYYWVASAQERLDMRTRANYNTIGAVFAGMACACFLLGLFFWLRADWMKIVGVLLASITLVYTLVVSFIEIVQNG